MIKTDTITKQPMLKKYVGEDWIIVYRKRFGAVEDYYDRYVFGAGKDRSKSSEALNEIMEGKTELVCALRDVSLDVLKPVGEIVSAYSKQLRSDSERGFAEPEKMDEKLRADIAKALEGSTSSTEGSI